MRWSSFIIAQIRILKIQVFPLANCYKVVHLEYLAWQNHSQELSHIHTFYLADVFLHINQRVLHCKSNKKPLYDNTEAFINLGALFSISFICCLRRRWANNFERNANFLGKVDILPLIKAGSSLLQGSMLCTIAKLRRNREQTAHLFCAANLTASWVSWCFAGEDSLLAIMFKLSVSPPCIPHTFLMEHDILKRRLGRVTIYALFRRTATSCAG